MKFEGIDQFLIKGKEKEKLFAELFSNYSISEKGQDIMEHWDVKIGNIKIDVKGLKRIKRDHSEVNENIHWVEIKGITGKLGWLYGMADYFAFETIKYWIIVKKESLQDYIKTNTIKEFTEYPTLNKLYNRKGRKDVITLVSTLDLFYISDSIIKKNTDTNGKEEIHRNT